MPDTDGFAVLEWMSGNRSQVPVVVLTSSGNPEHETRSLDLGARAFYRKPAALDELGDTVRTIVEDWVMPADVSVSGALPSAG